MRLWRCAIRRWKNGARRWRADRPHHRSGPGCVDAGAGGGGAVASGGGVPGAADLAALRFTVLQAALSALASVVCAIPLARALARRRFPGRALAISALGAPFLLPVIVAVLGLLAIFGRSGILNTALRDLGLSQVSIFGLGGVVLAHVFLNMPLATRMILQGWQAIPAERIRLAESLGFRAISHLAAYRTSDATGCGVGRGAGGIRHLPDQLCRRAGAGRWACGDDGGTGDLSGRAL